MHQACFLLGFVRFWHSHSLHRGAQLRARRAPVMYTRAIQMTSAEKKRHSNKTEQSKLSQYFQLSFSAPAERNPVSFGHANAESRVAQRSHALQHID
jgi:hypothetical protein